MNHDEAPHRHDDEGNCLAAFLHDDREVLDEESALAAMEALIGDEDAYVEAKTRTTESGLVIIIEVEEELPGQYL